VDTPQNLSKSERLCGRTPIAELLAQGRHGTVPGLRYLCRFKEEEGENRIMISVPKKFFKRAVKRNLLKRRIRESYRKQKGALSVRGSVDLLLMYPTKEIISYDEIYAAVGKIIEKINSRYGREESAASQDTADN